MKEDIANLYGLIGYPLSHSFSKHYFTEKFEREGIVQTAYELFPIEDITQLPMVVASQPNLRGLNVTIPYKQSVLPYLQELDESAATIGAVNTIQIQDGHLKGFNTDAIGFKISLQELLGNVDYTTIRALVLGNGGAAKAVFYVLDVLGISCQVVTRTASKDTIVYEDLTEDTIALHQLIINTTPLGMSPHIHTLPNLPYHALTSKHFLYDLVYNPKETAFLRKGIEQKSATINGLKMLHLQAEAAWKIWNQALK